MFKAKDKRWCSIKAFFKILQNPLENTCIGVSFLINLLKDIEKRDTEYWKVGYFENKTVNLLSPLMKSKWKATKIIPKFLKEKWTEFYNL